MKDLIIKVKQKGKKDDLTAEMTFEGDLTVSQCDKFRDKIMEVMDNHPKIEIRLQNVENIDLSILQIIASVKATLGPDRFRLVVTLQDDLKKLMSNTGFTQLLYN